VKLKKLYSRVMIGVFASQLIAPIIPPGILNVYAAETVRVYINFETSEPSYSATALDPSASTQISKSINFDISSYVPGVPISSSLNINGLSVPSSIVSGKLTANNISGASTDVFGRIDTDPGHQIYRLPNGLGWEHKALNTDPIRFYPSASEDPSNFVAGITTYPGLIPLGGFSAIDDSPFAYRDATGGTNLRYKYNNPVGEQVQDYSKEGWAVTYSDSSPKPTSYKLSDADVVNDAGPSFGDDRVVPASTKIYDTASDDDKSPDALGFFWDSAGGINTLRVMRLLGGALVNNQHYRIGADSEGTNYGQERNYFMSVKAKWMAKTYLYTGYADITYEVPLKPDLAAVEIKVDASCIETGSTHAIKYSYRNNGVSTSTSFEAQLKLDSVVKDTITVPGAVKDALLTGSYNYTFSDTAPKDFSLVVNTNSAVDEEGLTSNNTVSATFQAVASCSGPVDPGGGTSDLTGTLTIDQPSIPWKSNNRFLAVVDNNDTATCKAAQIKFVLKDSAGTEYETDYQNPGTFSGKPGADELLVWLGTKYRGDITYGTVSVTGVVKDTCGDFLRLGPKTFVIGNPPPNSPPEVSIGWFKSDMTTKISSGIQGDTVGVKVISKSDPDGDPVTVTWTFTGYPDSSAWVASLPAVKGLSSPYTSASYAGFLANAKDSHKICAVATDGRGGSTTACEYIDIIGPEPIAVINGGISVKVGRSLSPPLDGDSSYSPIPGGTINHALDQWVNKQDKYYTPGNVEVQLHVFDNAGRRSVDPAKWNVTVIPDLPPIPSLQLIPSITRLGSSNLRNNSSSPDGDNIVKLEVYRGYDSFNSGVCTPSTLISSNAANIVFSPDRVGKYCFRVYVEEEYGLNASKDYTVEVTNEKPVVGFTISGLNYEPTPIKSTLISAIDMMGPSWKSTSLDSAAYPKMWVRDSSENSIISYDTYTVSTASPWDFNFRYSAGLTAKPYGISNSNLTKTSWIRDDTSLYYSNLSDRETNLYLGNGYYRFVTDKNFGGGSNWGGRTGQNFKFIKDGELVNTYPVAWGPSYTESICGINYEKDTIAMVDQDNYYPSVSTTRIYKFSTYMTGSKQLVYTITWKKIYGESSGCLPTGGYPYNDTAEVFAKAHADYKLYMEQPPADTVKTYATPDLGNNTTATLIKVSVTWNSYTSYCNGHSGDDPIDCIDIFVNGKDPDGNIVWSKPLCVECGQTSYSGISYNNNITWYMTRSDGGHIRYFRVSDGYEQGWDPGGFGALGSDPISRGRLGNAYASGLATREGTFVVPDARTIKVWDIGPHGYQGTTLLDTIDLSDIIPNGYNIADITPLGDSKISVQFTKSMLVSGVGNRIVSVGAVTLESDPYSGPSLAFREATTSGQLINYSMPNITNATVNYSLKFNHMFLPGGYKDKATSGFSFRIVDNMNMYRVETSGEYTNLYKIQNGIKTLLGPSAYYPIDAGAYNSFSIGMDGANIKVKVNGSQIISVVDGTFPTGKLGPYSKRLYAEIKDVSYQEKQPSISSTIDGATVVDQVVSYNVNHFSDPENDLSFPNGAQWRYTQTDSTIFLDVGDGKSGTSAHNGIVSAGPILTFDKVGIYSVEYRLPDDPNPDHRLSNGDNSFAGYSRYSDWYAQNLVVHRRPISLFTISLDASNNVMWTDNSYDPDRCWNVGSCQAGYGANHGIYKKKYYYITPSGLLVEGMLIKPTEVGTYTVALGVADEYNAWSEWYEQTIAITIPVAANNPPTVDLVFPSGTQAAPSPVTLSPTITWNQGDVDPGTRFVTFNLNIKKPDGTCVECLTNKLMDTMNTTWSWTMDTLLEMGGTYTAQAQVSDGESWSAWSNIGWMITNRAPTATMSVPGGSQAYPTVFSTLTPTLEWDQSDPDPGTYYTYVEIDIFYADGITKVRPTINGWQGTYATHNSLLVDADLPAGVPMQVSVRVTDGFAWSQWSSTTWMLINRAPTAAMTYPDGTYASPTIIQNILRPVFAWNQSDPDSPTTYSDYQIQVADAGGFPVYDSGRIVQNIIVGSNTHTPGVDLPAGQLLQVRVIVWDQFYANGSSTWTWFYIDRPPVAAFTWTPPVVYEGDPIQLVDGSSDPDLNPITWLWTIQAPDGSITSSILETPPAIHALLVGNYSVTLKVTDNYGMTNEVTHLIHVLPLTITGSVSHIQRWEFLRQDFNLSKGSNPEMPWKREQFLAGEPFVLHANTTVIDPASSVTAQKVVVTWNRTADPFMLVPNISYVVWNGEMWNENYKQLTNGAAIFTFTVTYSNGTIKTAVIPVEILGNNVDDFWVLKRDK
jgi:hypothetical protein